MGSTNEAAIAFKSFYQFVFPMGNRRFRGCFTYFRIVFLFYLVKLVALGILLALIETMYAKIRLFKVPKLLGSSMILSLMAILLRVFE